MLMILRDSFFFFFFFFPLYIQTFLTDGLIRSLSSRYLRRKLAEQDFEKKESCEEHVDVKMHYYFWLCAVQRETRVESLSHFTRTFSLALQTCHFSGIYVVEKEEKHKIFPIFAFYLFHDCVYSCHLHIFCLWLWIKKQHPDKNLLYACRIQSDMQEREKRKGEGT